MNSDSIKEKYKDRFEEFSCIEGSDQEFVHYLNIEKYLTLLDSINQYHNDVVEELEKSIYTILQKGRINSLMERNRELQEQISGLTKEVKYYFCKSNKLIKVLEELKEDYEYDCCDDYGFQKIIEELIAKYK